MDIDYFRTHPDHLRAFLLHQRVRETPVRGGSICTSVRVTLESGESLFAKFLNDPTDPDAHRVVPPGFFAAEAAGLTWLRVPGGAPLPEVIGAGADALLLTWIDVGTPSASAAEWLGRGLATTHRAGAEEFGAPWPGYIGLLPQPNDAGSAWSQWYGEARLAPHLRTARDRGALSPDDAAQVDRLIADLETYAPPPERPARIHGDLWPGNVVWGADGRAWLVDPAAHGGHREADLAQLALFGGLPHLDRVLGAYNEVWPLAAGWRDRVALHQLHLLLVHAALFGPAYREQIMSAVRATVEG